MLKTLIRKELLDNLYSFRFIVSFVLVIFIMSISTIVLMQDYVSKKNAFLQNKTAYRTQIEKDRSNYLELMFSGIGADRPPAQLQIFYTGVEKNPNRSTNIFPFFMPRFMGELNINPVFPLFPSIDLLFVVSIVMSLLAFVFSYDAVSGERENGTLKLLMSYSIERSKIILAKWVGGYISLIIPYIFGALVSILIVGLNSKVALSPPELLAFALTVLVSLIFIGVMFSIGLFVSVKSKRSSTSISVLLFVWVIFVLIIPNSVPFLVDRIKPVESPSQVMHRIKYAAGNTLDRMIEDTISAFEDATGIKVSQVDFGKMGGDQEKKKEEKKETKTSTTEQSSDEGQQQQQQSNAQSGGESSGDSAKPQLPDGVNMDSIMKMAGDITDNDIRDLQVRGCERWISDQLQAKFGMTLEKVRQMAKDFNANIDVNQIIRECESRKSELLAMKRSGETPQAAAQEETGKGSAAATALQAVNTPEPPKQKKVTPEAYFAKLMALPDDEKGKFFDSMYKIFIDMNKTNSAISKEEEEKYQRKVDAQIALTKNLSRISPVSSYIYAVTDLADTGIERERDLKAFLWNYQGQFLDFLTKKFSAPNSERTHSIFGGFFKEAEYRLDELQDFNYKPIDVSKRLSFALIDIAILVCFVLIFFMAAYISFIKSEIID